MRCFDCMQPLKYNAANDEMFCSCQRTVLAAPRPRGRIEVDFTSGSFEHPVDKQAREMKEALAQVRYVPPEPVRGHFKFTFEQPVVLNPEPTFPEPHLAQLVAIDKITGQVYRNLQYRHGDCVGQANGEEHFLPEGSYDVDWE